MLFLPPAHAYPRFPQYFRFSCLISQPWATFSILMASYPALFHFKGSVLDSCLILCPSTLTRSTSSITPNRQKRKRPLRYWPFPFVISAPLYGQQLKNPARYWLPHTAHCSWCETHVFLIHLPSFPTTYPVEFICPVIFIPPFRFSRSFQFNWKVLTHLFILFFMILSRFLYYYQVIMKILQILSERRSFSISVYTPSILSLLFPFSVTTVTRFTIIHHSSSFVLDSKSMDSWSFL